MTPFKGSYVCLICFIRRLRGVIGNLVGGGLLGGPQKGSGCWQETFGLPTKAPFLPSPSDPRRQWLIDPSQSE